LAEGNIPLYASGLDENAKQFASLHAVQRHMVDTNQCKMAYDGVGEEYADYYDYCSAPSQTEGEHGRPRLSVLFCSAIPFFLVQENFDKRDNL
jgi:hypothetical protein